MRKIFHGLLMTLALLLLISQPVQAAPAYTDNADIVYNDDDLDEGSGRYLTLLTSSIAEGDRGIATNPLIQLDFNKNVVNFSILRENLASLHLVDATGTSVPLQVVFPDDQLQVQVKRVIFIYPQSTLEADAQYSLIIDNTLRSKNGDYIDMAYRIKFTTGNQEMAQENALLTSLGLNILTYSIDFPPNENSIPGSSRSGGRSQTPLLPKEAAPFPFSANMLLGAIFFSVSLGVLLLALEIAVKRKAKLSG